MDNSIQEQLAEDLQQAKVTGKARASRIQKIVQSAAAQTMTEVKAGSGEVRSIAQNRVQAVIETIDGKLNHNLNQDLSQNVGETTEERPVNATESAAPVSIKTLIAKFLTVLKTKLATRFRQEYADLPRQYADLKRQATDQATQLNVKLTERYGDRYDHVKQRFQKVKVWYYQKRSQGEALDSNLVEQKQAEFVTKVGEAGTTIAHKEQQVRQKVKDLLQTAANHL